MEAADNETQQAMTPLGVSRSPTRLVPSGFVAGGAYMPDASSLAN